MTKLSKEYDKIVTVWAELGISQSLPKLVDIEAALTPELKSVIKKHKAELCITPAINETFRFKDLIKAFDKNQAHATYIWDDLWDQYDLSQPMRVSFVFMDAQNDYNEPHLYFTNMSLEPQRQALKDGESDALGPIEYLMLQAVHRPDYLDKKTWTRCVGLTNTMVGGHSFVGRVGSSRGQLYFVRSNGDVYPSAGVGRSMGLNLNLSAFPLHSASVPSFDFPEVEINGVKYIRVDEA